MLATMSEIFKDAHWNARTYATVANRTYAQQFACALRDRMASEFRHKRIAAEAVKENAAKIRTFKAMPRHQLLREIEWLETLGNPIYSPSKNVNMWRNARIDVELARSAL